MGVYRGKPQDPTARIPDGFPVESTGRIERPQRDRGGAGGANLKPLKI